MSDLTDAELTAEMQKRGWLSDAPASSSSGPQIGPTDDEILAELKRRKLAAAPAPTPAFSTPPPQQENVVTPPKQGLFGGIANAITGNDRKQQGVGEIGFTSVPEEKDQQFTGPLAALANALPKPVRNWAGAEEKAGGIALGMFLDPDEAHQAQIIKHNVPTAEFRRDQFGNLQARYASDPNPERGWAYINAPGASAQDAVTFPAEAEKFYLTSKAPGLKVAKGTPLPTAMGKAGATGAVDSGIFQTLAMLFGGPGPDGGDAAVNAIGAMGGQLVGHTLTTVAPAIPGIAKDAINAVGDRLPGGATRAAERMTLQQQAQQASMDAARAQAEQTARDAAARAGAQGAAIEQAAKDAGDAAAARASDEFSAQTGRDPNADAINRLAASFGVKLSKSQVAGDQEGVQFLHEAAAGLHGPGAQKAATAFLGTQNAALPGAIKSVAGDPTVLNPTAGVGEARGGVLEAKKAADAAEKAAWDKYRAAASRVRTRATTPAGNPGGVSEVTDGINQALSDSGAHMDLPEYATAYPHVSNVLKLAVRMSDAADTSSLSEVPDVDRVIQLKRFIDDQWDAADSDAERRLLSKMGTAARNWLKTAASGSLGRRAPVTGAALKDALALSEKSARTFRDNPVMQDLLATNRPVGSEAVGGQTFTDAQVAQKLFGGGESGLNLRGDSVGALSAIKEAVGASSPEWDSLRQAALQRLSQGLDAALANRQAPPILTTIKYINNALDKSGEGMAVLFSPEELARLRDAGSVLRAAAPPARNMANPSGSGIIAGKVAKGLFEQAISGLKTVPGVSPVVGGLKDIADQAKINAETSGAPERSFNISKRLADLWKVRGQTGAAIGAAAAPTEYQNEPGNVPGDPNAALAR